MMDSNSHARNQKQEIYDFLKSRCGQWVACYLLAEIALQYSARICELRKAGVVIHNRSEWRQGKRLSWFMLEEPKAIPEADQSNGTPALFPDLKGEHRDNG
jgi:hypothetical protein